MPRFLLAFVAVAFAPVFAFANPLRHVPHDAQLVVVVESPRKLVESVRKHDLYQSARALPQVREALDSTAARRFFQLVEYYERDLGAAWPELLDKIGGKGLAVASFKLEDGGPAMFVVEGTNEAAVADFFKLAQKLLEEELARQAVNGKEPEKLRRGTHQGAETIHLGDGFHAARRGAVLFIANQEKALHAGLSIATGKSVADRSEPQAARKLLGGDPLAWLWFDFAKVKETKQAKDYFESVKKDAFQTFVLGSNIDAFRRSDFIAAGVWQTDDGFRAAVRVPAKRADVPAELALHVPPAGTPGSLPLLEPKGVLYSQSFHLDLGTFWKDRKKVLNDQQLKDVEEFEKQVSKVIPGTTLGKLLEMSGPYHRIVSAHIDEVLYKTQPDQQYPPVALVSSMRDKQFGKSVSAALRAAGVLASFSTGVKMSEETHDGVAIVSYRFPENKPLEGDTENLRFNFVPSFAIVGDSLVVSSRPSLIKLLIPELRKTPDAGSAAVWRNRLYAAGVAETLRAYPDPVITQTVLSQGIGLDEAKKQVEVLAKWAATLGNASLEMDHQPDAYQIQFVWKMK